MQTLQHYLAIYGYAALLPLAIVEGPAVTVFAGLMVARGVLDPVAVYLIVVLGDLVGDLIYYAIGRWALGALSGWRWADRQRQRIAVMAPRIRGHAGKMLLFGKLTHSAGFMVLLTAGAVHIDLLRFLAFNAIGTLPKSLLLLLVGWSFGWVYGSFQGDLRIAGVAGFVLAAAVLLLLARRLWPAAGEHEA